MIYDKKSKILCTGVNPEVMLDDGANLDNGYVKANIFVAADLIKGGLDNSAVDYLKQLADGYKGGEFKIIEIIRGLLNEKEDNHKKS